MNTRTIKVSAVAFAAILSLGSSNAFAAELRTSQLHIKEQYIVVLKKQAASLSTERDVGGKPRVLDVARRLAANHGASLLLSYEHALRGFVVQANEHALARLLADPSVEYIEQDAVVTLGATQMGATWGLDRVDQRTRSLNGTYDYNNTASNVHAYVIDTGVLTSHSDFAGRIGNGYTAYSDGRGVVDCNGHGTHVAGTVGGSVYGLAKGVTLHPVRVLDCSGSGSWSSIIAGIDWVRANHIRPAVANMSIQGSISSSVDTAANNLINAGVTLVVAAGNYGADACNTSPARVSNAITVGSTNSIDARSSFSNTGSCVDLFAPGEGITSAWWTGTTAVNTISGTSMASPHVAGAAALYLSNNPTATPATVTGAILNNSTANVIANAGLGSPNRLLYSQFSGGGVPAPTITSFVCPDMNDSGAGRYFCTVEYAPAHATVSWSGGSGSSFFSNGTGTFNGRCTSGQSPRITVTVSIPGAPISQASSSFRCPMNPPS